MNHVTSIGVKFPVMFVARPGGNDLIGRRGKSISTPSTSNFTVGEDVGPGDVGEEGVGEPVGVSFKPAYVVVVVMVVVVVCVVVVVGAGAGAMGTSNSEGGEIVLGRMTESRPRRNTIASTIQNLRLSMFCTKVAYRNVTSLYKSTRSPLNPQIMD